MDKVLKVCLSSELPGIFDRKLNYIYLTYDKLELYFGQNKLSEDFVIAKSMPTDPVPGMIYILSTDGSVHRFVDYKDNKIANIESQSQISLLEKAGTIFYINNNKRYMDSQNRTLTLPFNNGNYELSVAMKKEQIFDNNTILKYNEDKERFEVYGETSEEFIDYSKVFEGSETTTVKIVTDGPKIAAGVKISTVEDNMVKAASDGLYVYTADKVNTKEFNEWSDNVTEFRKYAQNVIDVIESQLQHLEEVASEEAIRAEIMEILNGKYPTIEKALSDYKQIADSLDEIETEVLDYATVNISSTREELTKSLEENSRWEDLDDINDFQQEIDYYRKAEEYYYPDLTANQLQAILTNAAAEFFMDYIYEGEFTMTKKLGITLNDTEYIVTVREIEDEEETSESMNSDIITEDNDSTEEDIPTLSDDDSDIESEVASDKIDEDIEENSEDDIEETSESEEEIDNKEELSDEEIEENYEDNEETSDKSEENVDDETE